MHILGDQMGRADKEDTWVWKDRETTMFTVKLAYSILRDVCQGEKREMYIGFWRLKAQPSAHLLAWRVLEDKIATKANLVRRGIGVITNICSMCGEEEETTSHLFCTCRIAWLVWAKCHEWVGMASMSHRNSKNHLLIFRMSGVTESVNQVWGVRIVVVGELWKHRNRKVFRSGKIDPIEIFAMSQVKAWSWVVCKVRDACFSFSDWCLEPMV